MIKAVLSITGDVQGAGYRSYLIMAARKLGLEGYVENLPNGVVNVVCESEKERIEEFVSKIKIKSEIVEVENIKVKYDKPTGEFKGKGFVIKVEESFKGLIQEMFQGYATSEKYFRVGWGKQDRMLGKQDRMLEKQDKMLEKQDATIEVIGTRFDKTDEKYGDISKTMREMHNDLKEMKNLFAKLVNHIVKE